MGISEVYILLSWRLVPVTRSDSPIAFPHGPYRYRVRAYKDPILAFPNEWKIPVKS